MKEKNIIEIISDMAIKECQRFEDFIVDKVLSRSIEMPEYKNRWKSVKKDGLPKGNCLCLVAHKIYCPFPVLASFYEGEFFVNPGSNNFPPNLPISVTHYFEYELEAFDE